MSKSNSSFWDHPISTIEKAVGIRKQIEALQSSLSQILGGAKEYVTTAATGADRRKGKRSAAARAKMAAAQKARWAKKRAGTVATKAPKAAKGTKAPKAAKAAPAAKGPKKKRTMSPEARARIAAAQRARWAKQKASK